MLKARTIGTMLCLGALTALPACSMFGGDSGSSSSGQYRQSSYNNSGAYNTASTAPTAPPGSSMTGQAAVTPDMIRDVQSRLQQAGNYHGQVDGVWGPMTQRGVRDWQQAHNMSATGQLDMATLQAMNISAGGGQYGQDNRAAQPNYNTAGSRPTDSNYSSNMDRPATTNTPYTSQPATPPRDSSNYSTSPSSPSSPPSR